MEWIEEGKIVSIDSDALEYENSLTSNPDRRMRVKTYLGMAKESAKPNAKHVPLKYLDICLKIVVNFRMEVDNSQVS